MKATTYLYMIAFALLAASCANQRYAVSETDDIYYSASDRYSEENSEFATVEEVSGEDYQDDDRMSNEYFSVGKKSQENDVNPNAENAYVPETEFNTGQQPAQTQDDTADGTVVNNFYGNTNYYEGDYYDESYTSRLRRFNDVNLGSNYGYYDPFFVDPYWNWGWGWNPYPASGWYAGWNSWTGWSIGYNWGWGYSGYTRPWGYYGYGYCYDPWGWGYPRYWGWNNPYRYGGYWNGFHDGYYAGLSLDNNRGRSNFYGPRGSVTNRGFATKDGRGSGSSSGSSIEHRTTNEVGRVLPPENNTANDVAASNNTKTRSDMKDASRTSSARFGERTQVFQVKEESELLASNRNARSEQAAEKYNTTSRTNYRAETRAKYESSNLSRAENTTLRHPHKATAVEKTPERTRRPSQGTQTQRSDRAVQRNSRTYQAPQRQQQDSYNRTPASRGNTNTSRTRSGTVTPRERAVPSNNRSNERYYYPNRRSENTTRTRQGSNTRVTPGTGTSTPRSRSYTPSRTRSSSGRSTYSPGSRSNARSAPNRQAPVMRSSGGNSGTGRSSGGSTSTPRGRR